MSHSALHTGTLKLPKDVEDIYKKARIIIEEKSSQWMEEESTQRGVENIQKENECITFPKHFEDDEVMELSKDWTSFNDTPPFGGEKPFKFASCPVLFDSRQSEDGSCQDIEPGVSLIHVICTSTVGYRHNTTSDVIAEFRKRWQEGVEKERFYTSQFVAIARR